MGRLQQINKDTYTSEILLAHGRQRQNAVIQHITKSSTCFLYPKRPCSDRVTLPLPVPVAIVELHFIQMTFYCATLLFLQSMTIQPGSPSCRLLH